MSVIGEVMNNAVKETINKKETQTRPMNLCCLVPFFLKKIYKPTGTAANAKKACTYIMGIDSCQLSVVSVIIEPTQGAQRLEKL